jgi:glycosyltransferase involved in cell wall biosynthesis
LNIHIVGDVDRPCPPARQHGVVARREDLYDLLGRSKTIVCPSLLDAAPGVLFEASAMGCNVITSPNGGNWQLCNERLLAERCSADVFVSRINRSLAAPHEDNRERFRGGYVDLVDTLTAF